MSIVKILALGDSNTDYGRGDGTAWATRFQAALAGQFPATTFVLSNKGVSGQNTAQLLSNLTSQLAGENPEIVALMIGTNDGFNNGYTCTGDQGNYNIDPIWTLTDPTAIDAYDALYASIITQIEAVNNGTGRNGNKPLVILMSPPPCASYADQVNGTTILSWAYTRPTRNIQLITSKIEAAAQAGNRPFADINTNISLHAGWLNQGGADYLIYDGVHLNPAGRQIAADVCFNAVRPYLAADGTVSGVSPLQSARAVVSSAISSAGLAGNLAVAQLSITSMFSDVLLSPPITTAANGLIRFIDGGEVQLLAVDGYPTTIKRYTNNVWQ